MNCKNKKLDIPIIISQLCVMGTQRCQSVGAYRQYAFFTIKIDENAFQQSDNKIDVQCISRDRIVKDSIAVCYGKEETIPPFNGLRRTLDL